MKRRRKRSDLHTILVWLPVVLALDMVAWLLWAAWHALPWLLTLAEAVVVCKRWQQHRRALGWPNGAEPTRPPRLVHGHVVSETEDLRRQVAKLEQDAARHEQLVDDLADAAGRPIDAVTATYLHLQRQYGSAAVGKPGRSR
jgi:hypothetical protein